MCFNCYDRKQINAYSDSQSYQLLVNSHKSVSKLSWILLTNSNSSSRIL